MKNKTTKPTTVATPATTDATSIASVVAQVTQAAPEAKPAPEASGQAIAKPNARAHLRALFAEVGAVHTKEEVFGGYYNVTISTHLTDLKNSKYAGKLGTMSIVKLGDGTYKRVA